jgi:hypothetical protein
LGSDPHQDQPRDGNTVTSSDGQRQLHLEIQPYTLYFYDANLSQFALPTHILWPGFLLNTLFWSAVIASPFWLRRGFVAWRSARRRRAGLCPLCGYARGGINPQHPCPECGKSVPPAPQSTPSNAHTP